MRKKIIFVIIFLLLAYLVNSNNTLDGVDAAGVTLGQYEQKLREYKDQAARNKQAIKKTQAEINAANNRVTSLKNETLKLIEEVKVLNAEINGFKEEIKKKIDDTKHIIEYLQLIEEDNMYFNYVLRADSISEIIDREMVITQLLEYNNKSIEEMEKIVAGNVDRQKKIDERQNSINRKETELKNNIEFLGDKKDTLMEGGVSIEKQIKIYDELVRSYRNLGCKTNDVIGVDCARSDSGVFRRPTERGYITQEQYYGASYSHRGMDITSSRGKGEKIYPVADGRVTAKYSDGWGALTVVIEHYSAAKGKYYSSMYVHLNSYAPGIAVGKKVTSNQYIGYMGTTGRSTGVHLHLELFPCRLYNLSDRNCNNWTNYYNYSISQLRQGYNIRQIITFPKGTGWRNSWSSR